MTKDKHRQVGLSKRELESRVKWILDTRKVPMEPHALARYLGDLVASLIDQNNQAIAASLGAGDDDKPQH